MEVSINPQNNIINCSYFNGKWNKTSIKIKIEQYNASSVSPIISEIERIIWNIVALVAQRTYIPEKHYSDSRPQSNTYIKHDMKNMARKDMVKLTMSNSISSNQDVLVVNHRNINNVLAEKKMHYRKGHWHYYWYGARNSNVRHKELRWVEETIVNRDATNIIIVL